MFVSSVLVAVCLTGSSILAAYVLDKPYYEVENAENLFRDYIKEYGKVYNRVEYLERLEIFKKSLHNLNRRNAKHPMTVFGIDHFADLRPHERQRYFGYKPSNVTREQVTIPDGPAAPDTLDWRDQHVVTHVKNQGACGSCFIFSAVANIEGQYAIKHQECLALSEGQAIDCLPSGTCGGGEMVDIMRDFSQTAGVEKETDYPYIASKNQCQKDDSKVAVKVLDGQLVATPDEDTLKQKLADIGPLAISLSAQDFDGYRGGILLPDACKGLKADHAVLLVGYGEENGTKYWLIKNSWGEQWGESGYVRLIRGVNACDVGTSGDTATATVE